jgi:hypothetical protein
MATKEFWTVEAAHGTSRVTKDGIAYEITVPTPKDLLAGTIRWAEELELTLTAFCLASSNFAPPAGPESYATDLAYAAIEAASAKLQRAVYRIVGDPSTQGFQKLESGHHGLLSLVQNALAIELHHIAGEFKKVNGTPIPDSLVSRFRKSLAELKRTIGIEPQKTEPFAEPTPTPGAVAGTGVTLFDVAFAIEQDDRLATATVKKWSDSKKITATQLGNCPRDGRRKLYPLSEILSDVAKLLSLSSGELGKYRQVLTAQQRLPSSD